ncbi:MAG: hypothetical protein H7A44_04200 [Opitutaceae bacterium]|nr:hypothetical protein [Opitutaceae bacterium]
MRAPLRPYDYLILFLLGGVLGALSGAMVTTVSFDGESLGSFAALGALTWALSPRLRRAESYLCYSSNTVAHPPTIRLNAMTGNCSFVSIGLLFIATSLIRPSDSSIYIPDNWLYVVIPAGAILAYGIGCLLRKHLNVAGCALFAALGALLLLFALL